MNPALTRCGILGFTFWIINLLHNPEEEVSSFSSIYRICNPTQSSTIQDGILVDVSPWNRKIHIANCYKQQQ